jgi:hypothetical protein
MPEVDPDRIFVAGHSSAGTVALLCAEHVDGLAGCVAYAPCSDLEGSMAGIVKDIERVLPNVRQYMTDGSPSTYLQHLRCPVMIFHAIDDQVVRLSESRGFVQRATSAGQDATLRTGARGGHYDAMIDEGIDEAIRWMNRTGPATTTTLASSPTPLAPRKRELPSLTPRNRELPPPTPGFVAPLPPDTPSIQAHVRFKIISYPSSGDPASIARDALRSVIWADLASIRVDRTADELIIGASGTAVNSNTAKLLLEQAGFVIGGVTYEPIRR